MIGKFGPLLLLSVSLTTFAAIAGDEDDLARCKATASIGVAYMEKDGTIRLRIRSLPPGPIAEGEFRYAPGDRDYESIRAHVGGLTPGESKPVPPWC